MSKPKGAYHPDRQHHRNLPKIALRNHGRQRGGCLSSGDEYWHGARARLPEDEGRQEDFLAGCEERPSVYRLASPSCVDHDGNGRCGCLATLPPFAAPSPAPCVAEVLQHGATKRQPPHQAVHRREATWHAGRRGRPRAVRDRVPVPVHPLRMRPRGLLEKSSMCAAARVRHLLEEHMARCALLRSLGHEAHGTHEQRAVHPPGFAASPSPSRLRTTCPRGWLHHTLIFLGVHPSKKRIHAFLQERKEKEEEEDIWIFSKKNVSQTLPHLSPAIVPRTLSSFLPSPPGFSYQSIHQRVASPSVYTSVLLRIP